MAFPLRQMTAVLFGAFVVGSLSAEQPGARITLPFGFGWRVSPGGLSQ